ncbi:hypothetical protein LOSG293_110270 [Secundilactobacillus oryzae JCM 18671]|uniref:Uncharacterized protein n=1 Tax=Secundilactobacillus oryzae JCM 18671 TaxID=1291743 RepID=A0A081BI43_9LACO|nr:hypothetical protein [Secundilactobacillus oryzae]GAK47711.1 hypothetical protein LOSG293_110270 [Secundilactobacillus oryzae JCM 18671]
MPAKVQRLMSRNINKIFRLMSVDFEYAIPTTTADDHWGDQSKEPLEWQSIREPIISVGNSASTLVKLPGGDASSYSWEWLSHLEVPEKTVVRYRGQQFSVTRYGDSQDIVGAYLYFLQGRSDHIDVQRKNL